MDPIYSAVERSGNIIKSIMADPHIKKYDRLNKIMKEALQELQNCREGAVERKNKAIAILQDIDQHVGNTDTLNIHKSNAIHAKLKGAIELLTTADAKEITPSKPNVPHIDMNLAFLCDVDAPDHNGAIESSMRDIFLSNTPFVATRSLLCSTKNEGNNRFQLEEILLKNAANWSIYQQHTPNGEGFLVFLPRAAGNADESRELLESYDFNPANLEKITALQALTPPQENVCFESFAELFTDSPSKSKLFFLDGHGGVGRPGGLTADHYEDILQLFARLNCKVLAVTSCDLGGESTLLHIEKAKATYEEKVQADYRNRAMGSQELKFPVIVRSIGDYPTLAGQLAESNFAEFFSGLARFLESGHGETVSGMRTVVRTSEGYYGSIKDDRSLNQVYYPSGADSPAGFRPVGEKGQSFSLTFHRLQSEKLLGSQQIRIENKKFIEIHPLVVDIPIVYQEKAPILLSMIPGKAHHYLRGLELAQGSIEEFFKKNTTFHKEGKLGVSKGFYIDKLSSAKGEEWEQVALFFGNRDFCLYCKGGNYYYWNGTSTKQISKIQYALALEDWSADTKPRDSAILSQTGGMEENSLFDQALNIKIPSDITDVKDQEALVFHLLSSGKADLALARFQRHGLSPNMTNIFNRPLLVNAATNNADDLFLYLLEKGAEPSSKSPTTGNTPLHIAIINNNIPMVKALLSKGADLEARNDQGYTPIFYTLPENFELFQQLKAAGADINALANGCSILALALRQEDRALFSKLLDEGIDPNLGDPSPLHVAIVNNDSAAIDMLLEKGAKLGPAIFEAMERCPHKVVEKLLQNIDPALQDEGLLLAVRLANLPCVKTLLAKGAKLPFSFDKELKMGLRRMEAASDYKVIEALLKSSNRFRIKEFELAIFDNLAALDLELVKSWIDQGFFKNPEPLLEKILKSSPSVHLRPILEALIANSSIDLNQKGGSYQSYFHKIISLGDLELVKLAVAKGGKLVEKWDTPLNNAVAYPEIFKWLVDQGAGINLESSALNDSPFYKVVKLGDVPLAKFCIDHGARLDMIGFDGTDTKTKQKLQDIVLKIAAESGNDEMVNLIKSKISNDNAADDKLLEKWAALDNPPVEMRPGIYEAMERGSPEVVEKLLKGINPAAEDKEKINPLLLALRFANLPSVETLLAKKATIPYRFEATGLEMISKGLKLMETVSDYRIIEAILKQRSTEEFELALFDNLASEHPDLILNWMNQGFFKDNKLILEKILKSSPGNHLRPILKALIASSSFDLNEKMEYNGPSHFQRIISFDDLELVKLAAAKGGEIERILGDAVEQPSIFKLLVEQGADINFKTYYIQNCLLFKVVKSGNVELAKFCFDHGARLDLTGIDTKNYQSETKLNLQDEVLKIATESGNAEMIALIKSKIS